MYFLSGLKGTYLFKAFLSTRCYSFLPQTSRCKHQKWFRSSVNQVWTEYWSWCQSSVNQDWQLECWMKVSINTQLRNERFHCTWSNHFICGNIIDWASSYQTLYSFWCYLGWGANMAKISQTRTNAHVWENLWSINVWKIQIPKYLHKLKISGTCKNNSNFRILSSDP